MCENLVIAFLNHRDCHSEARRCRACLLREQRRGRRIYASRRKMQKFFAHAHLARKTRPRGFGGAQNDKCSAIGLKLAFSHPARKPKIAIGYPGCIRRRVYILKKVQ